MIRCVGRTILYCQVGPSEERLGLEPRVDEAVNQKYLPFVYSRLKKQKTISIAMLSTTVCAKTVFIVQPGRNQ